jgi:hypothetical protein
MDRVRHLVHDNAAIYDGSISGPPSPATRSADRTWTHTESESDSGAHAVEFSKTATPCREGDSFSRDATRRHRRLARTVKYSALPARPPRAATWPCAALGGPRDCSGYAGGERARGAKPGARGVERCEERSRGRNATMRGAVPRAALRTAPAPTRRARVGGRRSRAGRSAARSRGPARRRRPGSLHWGRSAPRAGGCARSCRG